MHKGRRVSQAQVYAKKKAPKQKKHSLDASGTYFVEEPRKKGR